MSTESDRWAARRATWRVERLDPARARAPERRDRFVTLGDIPLEGLYGPWSLQETPDGGPAGGGGPTALDRDGEPLAGGRWDDFDAARDIGLPGEAPFTRGTPAFSAATMYIAQIGAAGELIVIEVETRSRGSPDNRTSMSARELTATPHVPNSPSASGSSVS